MDEEINGSILQSIKKQLNVPPAVTQFDSDISLLINSAFATLTQLGVGPDTGYKIESEENTWDEFFTDIRLSSVKEYVFLKVRTVFDPPTGSVLSSYDKYLKEIEWRLSVAAEELKQGASDA